jgi:hypothetical protein
MGVFDFGATLSGVGDLINQVRNHHRRGFIARQARSAKHQQRVVGPWKIRVVGHHFLDSGFGHSLGMTTGFHGIRDACDAAKLLIVATSRALIA